MPEEDQSIKGDHGTKVVLRDLFGNLGVRLKRRAIQYESVEHIGRELDRLRIQIAALALAWPRPVRIVVSDQQAQRRRRFAVGTAPKGGGQGQIVRRDSQALSSFRIHDIRTIMSHAGHTTPKDRESWTSMSARTSQIFVRAAICLQPAPSKHLQFMSLGVHPLNSSSTLSQVLYREVNSLFAESAFGAVEDDLDVSEQERLRRLRDGRFKIDSYTVRQLKGRGKGADRWPMFYIRIDTRQINLPLDIPRLDEDDKQAAQFLEKAVLLIRSMIYQFLQEHHFQPRVRRRRSEFQSGGLRSSTIGPTLALKNERKFLPESVESSHHVCERQPEQAGLTIANPEQKEGQQPPSKASSADAFASWSRTKSAKPRASENLLSGLPRSKLRSRLQPNINYPIRNNKSNGAYMKDFVRPTLSTGDYADEEVQLLLRELSENADEEGSLEGNHGHNPEVVPPSSVAKYHEGPPTPQDNNIEEGTVAWTNPVSGKSIRINSRTGLSLPDLPRCHDNEARPARTSRGSLKKAAVYSGNFPLSAEMRSESNDWLGSLLTGWRNPVFRLKERPIPSAVVEQDDGTRAKARKCCHGKYHHCSERAATGQDRRLSKAALASADILGQVDKKFILAILRTSGLESSPGTKLDSGGIALALIDQHAADERCRVEDLYAEISMGNAATTKLAKAITFETTAEEIELFRREKPYFESWGILYNLSLKGFTAQKNRQATRPASARPRQTKAIESQRRPATVISSNTAVPLSGQERDIPSNAQVVVYSLPELIAERCRADPKVLIDILRSEIWARSDDNIHFSTHQAEDEDIQTDGEGARSPHTWLKRISSCPGGITDLLNSRACRSAVMFNDELSKAECAELVTRLRKCAFPFQCAHGRPSMIVLGGLDCGADQLSGPFGYEGAKYGNGRIHLRGRESEKEKENEPFMHAFKRWQLQGEYQPSHSTQSFVLTSDPSLSED